MNEPNLAAIATHYAGIPRELGADVEAEGLRDTATRAARTLVEVTEVSRLHGTFERDESTRAERFRWLGPPKWSLRVDPSGNDILVFAAHLRIIAGSLLPPPDDFHLPFLPPYAPTLRTVRVSSAGGIRPDG